VGHVLRRRNGMRLGRRGYGEAMSRGDFVIGAMCFSREGKEVKGTDLCC